MISDLATTVIELLPIRGLLLHPASWFLLGAALLPLAHRLRLQKGLLIGVPLLSLLLIYRLPESFGATSYLGFALQFGRADQLAFVFLHMFAVMAIISCLYSLHVKDVGQHIAAFLYVAGAFGATLAGDYLTLFIFWELMAFASVFLIWCRRRPRSTEAGLRYLLVHISGGLILLAGIFLRYQQVHDLQFVRILAEQASFADYLILIGFALNAAVPPLHAWMADAYPEGTVTGAVFLSAFTSKTAVYALARAFAGFEILAVIGAVMALYGVCYVVVENDSRRVLAYHIISQVGYMVCAIGIGTALAVNAACAHAYTNVIYKGLLFMGVGSVLQMTGRSKLSELGGLYRCMPLTLIFTVIGGIAISGFPLTSGFASKTMVVAAAGESHHSVLMLLLLAAAVGTFLSVGIKLPYCIWYRRDAGIRAQDPPWNMLASMAIAAFLCIFIGIYPEWLYRMLPFATDFRPYTAPRISETLQILGFTGLGFYLLAKKLGPEAVINLDTDWFYRKGTALFMGLARGPVNACNEIVGNLYKTAGLRFTTAAARQCSRFDRRGVDGVVDGGARKVLEQGDRLRRHITGRLQQYIGASLAALFILLALVLWW
jgi:multicomponent Na+:H+ antiporter subunit D